MPLPNSNKTNMLIDEDLRKHIEASVAIALLEDVGPGDLTAELVDRSEVAKASIVARVQLTLAGSPWVDEVFHQIDSSIKCHWHAMDGEKLAANTVLCEIRGSARAVLTGERTALNFLQTLSATSTATTEYVRAVAHTNCRILDTRKTLPGLRSAQKYAVRMGGGFNHRFGLFDAILIKENHIAASGGIADAVIACRKLHPNFAVEVEVESIAELREALSCKAERILLDNFSLEMLRRAVAVNSDLGSAGAKLEASGGLSFEDLVAVAETGVDYVSIGALTKNIRAIDLSMRFAD